MVLSFIKKRQITGVSIHTNNNTRFITSQKNYFTRPIRDWELSEEDESKIDELVKEKLTD